MIWGGWEPTPPRPGSLDDAMARGFDPDSARLPDSNEPLNAEWQEHLSWAIRAGFHRRDPELIDDRCGIRCDRCDERMCAIDGPEPRACGVTCADCSCDCQKCTAAREDMRAELRRQIEREAS